PPLRSHSWEAPRKLGLTARLRDEAARGQRPDRRRRFRCNRDQSNGRYPATCLSVALRMCAASRQPFALSDHEGLGEGRKSGRSRFFPQKQASSSHPQPLIGKEIMSPTISPTPLPPTKDRCFINPLPFCTPRNFSFTNILAGDLRQLNQPCIVSTKNIG